MLPAIPAARAYSQAGAPLLLLDAGAFQFSSLKRRCLDKCGSAMACVTGHWRERPNPWLAFRLGLRGGIFCVGCCWAVMLLMFLAGAGSLGWMLVLAAFMGIEKNLPLGRRMSAPAGIVLLIAGAALMAARFA
jgi:predicted metal-binding membrane protein